MAQSFPFAITKTESFYDKLSEWIGDVFYDILPEKGFELRDEQIFMAFQLEKAFKDKKIMFAEAGVGTGKTISYLLYSIFYARYFNKPAIISCADETLIEQLVKKEGDISKLEKALGIQVDVRLAKSHEQYLCLNKLDHAVNHEDSEAIDQVFDELPKFVLEGASMSAYKAYGDRKMYSYVNDEDWNKINWDPLQSCFTCDKRHRCGQTLSRDFYRKSSDLIICSHDFFMEHVWTKESRKREGQLPLLPEYSCVVFDEGHLLEFAAQKALTYKIAENTISAVLDRLSANDIRDETLYVIDEILEINQKFFSELNQNAVEIKGSNRLQINMSNSSWNLASRLHDKIQELEDNLVFDAEMYTIDDYQLKVTEEYLEGLAYSLSLLLKERQAVVWFEQAGITRTLVIMPRLVKDILSEQVFSQKVPYIFSSATLSDNKSFDYIADSLGIKDYLSFSVESPFEYDEVMKIAAPSIQSLEEKLAYTMNSLREAGGSSLVLFNSKEELLWFKEHADKDVSFPIYYEGDAEISDLVRTFQEEENSVLCSYHLWEGLDIPGPSLRNVVIFSLPYPPKDPVFEAKRQAVQDPFLQVDLPYMLLRLRQGIGRLIRTTEDRGTVHILLPVALEELTKSKIQDILPVTPN
ncbi:ATP-dependent DNA helicase DinG [Peribacillus deserti]|uniref:ATP-dependent DNA helicase DinG n=1 Tax=Peribacillus deserti TaxID=673318 RepID=A0ABS2QHK7_9BACI|nr:ATP-dependent DNA helicase [Peribacillus deserti]MBM7692592.1 ATP-dependent DNA helicase DinG [Peribacillus deserti]